jgi:hypothetical protein
MTHDEAVALLWRFLAITPQWSSSGAGVRWTFRVPRSFATDYQEPLAGWLVPPSGGDIIPFPELTLEEIIQGALTQGRMITVSGLRIAVSIRPALPALEDPEVVVSLSREEDTPELVCDRSPDAVAMGLSFLTGTVDPGIFLRDWCSDRFPSMEKYLRDLSLLPIDLEAAGVDNRTGFQRLLDALRGEADQ